MNIKEGKLDEIRDARVMFEFEPEYTDEALLERDSGLRAQLTEAQLTELDEDEVVKELDQDGWALTVGGVYIDTKGVRHFGPGSS